MVAVKLTAFGGMIPAQDDHLLPENNSVLARNTFLDTGALQGFKIPKLLHTMGNPSNKYAFRIPQIAPDMRHIFSSFWWEFSDPDTNVLKTPVADDQYERFYAVSPTLTPSYNTKARVLNGDPNYVLGIPAPETAPGVAVVGGSATNETRAYVYTWVSAYGEEGPPSDPTLLAGHPDGSWNITLTAPLTGDTTGRNLTKVRIYRTITDTSGSAVYYQVVEQAIGSTTYSDTISDTTVSLNTILPSVLFSGPPDDLEGWVSMPNGMIVGWRANEIWFCEPYLPHAWPASYTLSVDFDVVGLGVVGQTLVVLTEGYPYAATGTAPISMTLSKIATIEPCLSRGSIISTALGVLYASPNGIVLAAFGIVQNATQQMLTKASWLDLVSPASLRAAKLGPSYYAWGTPEFGCFEMTAFDNASFELMDFTNAYDGVSVNLSDQRISWAALQDDGGVSTDNVMTDVWSGEIFLVREGEVVWLDMSSAEPMEAYLWRSKVFQLDKITNLAALRVSFDPSTVASDFVQNTTRNVDLNMVLDAGMYGIMRVYADGVLVMARELRTSGELMKIPSGFKKEYWQFEIEARVKVLNLQVGASTKDMVGV